MGYRSYGSSELIWYIIGACVAMFVFTFVSPSLIFRLGFTPMAFLQQPWTIVTNLFLHGGVWHLLTNMFTLYFFGNYLLQLIGKGKFLALYFGAGIIGNVFFYFLSSPFATAIGASGAIFGLGGALAAMRPKLPVIVFPIPVPIPLWVAVIGGFLLLTLFPGVAWQAHLGGLAVGLVAGYFFRKKESYYY